MANAAVCQYAVTLRATVPRCDLVAVKRARSLYRLFFATRKQLRLWGLPDFQAQRGLGCAGLELEFQRELQLPSRAEVPDREAGAGDPSERGALDIQIGVPEVRMIENVKGFRPELQAHALRELRILDQGQVGVHEVRSGERIATKIAEMASAGNDGISVRGSWHIAESAWNGKRCIGR